MNEVFLVPKKTVVNANGHGPAIDVSTGGQIFLLTLAITDIIEQESLDVRLFGSADAAMWTPRPIVAFPQKFYCDEVPLLLDLTTWPEIKFIRAHWEVTRWGRGWETPRFEFHITLREVSQEILAEAAGRVPMQQT
jgi:hypothetical protein